VEARLSLYRSILEAKVALRALERAELLLIDGSLLADLLVRGFGEGLEDPEKEEVKELLPALEEGVGGWRSSPRS
jgi:hypothetical protein